jgi:hypothetical protein
VAHADAVDFPGEDVAGTGVGPATLICGSFHSYV